MYSKTQNQNEDKITLWTSITPSERARVVHWFASRPTPEQLSMFSEGELTVLPNLQKANPEYARIVFFAMPLFYLPYDAAATILLGNVVVGL